MPNAGPVTSLRGCIALCVDVLYPLREKRVILHSLHGVNEAEVRT